MNTATAGSPLVLVIDDISPVVRLIELELGLQGFRTASCLVGQQPIDRAEELQPHAIVLSSAWPTPLQYDLLQKLKARVPAPVLFLHSGGGEGDAALALEMGASGTLQAPFNPEELVLHLNALLDHNLPEAQKIGRAGYTIDPLHRLVWRGEQKVTLATSEWALLSYLIQQDDPVSADDLLVGVWGEGYKDEKRFLELWIEHLRVNLGEDPQQPTLILGNIREGYYLGK